MLNSFQRSFESMPHTKQTKKPSVTSSKNAIAEMRIDLITAEEEYSKNKEIKKEDIEELLQFANVNHSIENITEKQMILFYHSHYFDKAATYSGVDHYCKIRLASPEFFKNRDASRPELQQALKILQFSIIPVKHPLGYQIIYCGLQDFDARKYVFIDAVKLIFMAIDGCLYVEGTNPGFMFLLNNTGVKFTHLLKVSISSVKKALSYVQEAFPLRMHSIHILNKSAIGDRLLYIVKPFTKTDLMEKVHFYSSNYEDVYQSIPKSCLPIDFNGELPSVAEFHERFCNWLIALAPKFLEDELTFERKWEKKSIAKFSKNKT